MWKDNARVAQLVEYNLAKVGVAGSSPRRSICSRIYNFIILARWLSWLERRPVTAEVVGSNPIRVVYKN